MAPRRRYRRRFGPAPLLAIALALAVAVVLAVVPHKPRGSQPRKPAHVAVQAATTVSPAPATAPAPPEVTASAAASASPSGKAQLAIIIDDCGQWPQIERGFVNLPIAITLSIMPHVRYAAEIAQLASKAGKGVMLHLPMEPLSHKRSGPGEIETSMSDSAIDAQTVDDLDQVPLARGVNNHEGSAATADPRVMKDVLQEVKARGLFFIDSRTSAATVAALQARADGIPTASRDVFLDNVKDEAYTERMLLRAAAAAKLKGSAIAIGHPNASTLAALRNLYQRLQVEGVEFVPAANLVH